MQSFIEQSEIYREMEEMNRETWDTEMDDSVDKREIFSMTPEIEDNIEKIVPNCAIFHYKQDI